MIMTNSHSKHRRRDAKLGFTFASLGLHPVRAPWTRAPLSAPTPNTTTLTIHRAYPVSLTSYPPTKTGHGRHPLPPAAAAPANRHAAAPDGGDRVGRGGAAAGAGGGERPAGTHTTWIERACVNVSRSALARKASDRTGGHRSLYTLIGSRTHNNDRRRMSSPGPWRWPGRSPATRPWPCA